jgi:hypothetical protein
MDYWNQDNLMKSSLSDCRESLFRCYIHYRLNWRTG